VSRAVGRWSWVVVVVKCSKAKIWWIHQAWVCARLWERMGLSPNRDGVTARRVTPEPNDGNDNLEMLEYNRKYGPATEPESSIHLYKKHLNCLVLVVEP
jgi:hypothetical protein